jgi:hypothetical protein
MPSSANTNPEERRYPEKALTEGNKGNEESATCKNRLSAWKVSRICQTFFAVRFLFVIFVALRSPAHTLDPPTLRWRYRAGVL